MSSAQYVSGHFRLIFPQWKWMGVHFIQPFIRSMRNKTKQENRPYFVINMVEFIQHFFRTSIRTSCKATHRRVVPALRSIYRPTIYMLPNISFSIHNNTSQQVTKTSFSEVSTLIFRTQCLRFNHHNTSIHTFPSAETKSHNFIKNRGFCLQLRYCIRQQSRTKRFLLVYCFENPTLAVYESKLYTAIFNKSKIFLSASHAKT